MSAGLNARNPYSNQNKGTQQGKKPLKNPFANIHFRLDESDNEFQTLNLSNNNENQNQGLQSPFGAKALDDVTNQRAFFGQPMGVNNSRKQPFENPQANRGDAYQRGYQNDGSSNVSQIYPQQQQNFAGNQEPYFSNSFMSGLSRINNFFGESQQGKEQPQQVYDEDNEPPLLEDLGIDLDLIKQRTLAVLKFKHLDERFAKDADMSGPLLIALFFGSLLLIRQKISFGYIYGFGVMGTICIYMIINLLSQHSRAKLYNTMSILGYCLIPITILAFINVFLNLVTWYGFILSFFAVTWATIAATRFFQVLLNLEKQKYLIGYPVFLFYLVFVLLALF